MERKFYQTELLNLNGKKNYRLIIDLLFHCQKPHPSLKIEYAYYQEFGPKEKFKEMKKELNLERKIE